MIKDPSFQGSSIPSCLYYNTDGNWLFGSSAWNSRRRDPNRFIHSELKGNLLSHGGKEPIALGERYFALEELIGELLKWIKEEADRMAQSWGESAMNSVNLTVPVDYGPARREVMEKAAILAGFKHVELLDEPVAAALSVLKQSKIKSGETVLIYDLGGGTFDAALVRQNGNQFEVLAKDGLPQCDGVHFDHAIYRWLTGQATQAQADLAPFFDRHNKQIQAQQVRLTTHDNCREAKHHLSNISSWDIQVPAGDYSSYPLYRSDLEIMLAGYLDQTMTVSRRVLGSARIKASELDRIVMVGGSTRIPAVAGLLKQVFGKDPVLAIDPELAIAEGAVLFNLKHKEGNKVIPNELSSQVIKISLVGAKSSGKTCLALANLDLASRGLDGLNFETERNFGMKEAWDIVMPTTCSLDHYYFEIFRKGEKVINIDLIESKILESDMYFLDEDVLISFLGSDYIIFCVSAEDILLAIQNIISDGNNNLQNIFARLRKLVLSYCGFNNKFPSIAITITKTDLFSSLKEFNAAIFVIEQHITLSLIQELGGFVGQNAMSIISVSLRLDRLSVHYPVIFILRETMLKSKERLKEYSRFFDCFIQELDLL